MSLKKSLMKQSGFSLTEILIALGILGGVSLVTMKLMGDQTTNQAYIKSRAEIDKTTSLVSAYLGDKGRCNAFVGGVQFGQPIPKIAARGSTQEQVILKAGADYGEFSMDEDSIKIEKIEDDSSLAKLVLKFRLKNTSFLKAASRDDSRLIVKKEIEIPIIREKDGVGQTIAACGQRIGDEETHAREVFCTSLGEAFAWNVTTKECVAREKRCPNGQMMVRLTSLGGYVCADAKDHVVLDDIFELNVQKQCNQGFALEYDPATKKIGIKCKP